MRLLLLNGNTTPEITARCAEAARAVARPGTEVAAFNASRGPRIITTRAENALAEAAMVELLAEHGAGADAVLVAISFDTGLEALREAARVPVVGMTAAALHVAALSGGPIGFIGPGRRALNIYRDTAVRSGLDGRIVGYRCIDMAPEDYLTPGPTLPRIAALAAELIDRGAESIVLAGAAMAGLTPEIQASVPVPVIDGIKAGVALAEALVALGLPKATMGSSAALPRREILGAGPALARLFGGGPE
ncbi:aspartate/glutamate racemase family protein [Zavarzinia sp.]|uniref:aspartate/glutamate racemase family protein n=1 Tax=Zavarzinia sp. TaxID=2027920 RepID=UPI00356793E2